MKHVRVFVTPIPQFPMFHFCMFARNMKESDIAALTKAADVLNAILTAYAPSEAGAISVQIGD